MGTLGLTDSQNYADIAEAIRLKSGTSSVYLPSEMALAIRQISGGGAVILQDKTATPSTATQTITADAGYDGLGKVTVNHIPTDYLIPTGIKQITENGIYDVAAFKSANVAVPTGSDAPTISALTIVPNDSEQSFSAAMSGVDGFSPVTVAAISGDYVGNDIPRITSNTQFTVNNNSITVPSGYYENALSKSIGTTKAAATITPGTTNQVINSGTYLTGNQTILGDSDLVPDNIRKDIKIFNVTGTYEAGSVEPVLQEKTASSSTAKQTITADAGYDGLSKVTINAMAAGTATTPAKTINVTPSISVNSANGQISVSVSGSSAITPTVSAGYVSQGTSGTVSVSGSSSYNLATKSAATITPSTANQTIAANQFLIGAQTIKGDANLVAANIKKNIKIFNVTGTYEAGGGAPTLQAKTAAPSEVEETIVADAGYDGLSSVTIEAIPSSYVGSGVARNTAGDISNPSTQHVSIPAGFYENSVDYLFPVQTLGAKPEIDFNAGTGVITPKFVLDEETEGYYYGTITGNPVQLPTASASTYTPTESEQTILGVGTYVTGSIKIAAISSTYIGSNIARKSSADLTASGSVITAPAGYYSASASKAIAAGSVAVPSKTITANPTISVSAAGVITASVAGSSNVSPTVTAGYVTTGTQGTMSVSGSSTFSLTTQAAKTITPSESQQTAVASQRYTTGNVVVAAISADYVGSSITKRSSADLTASGSAITAPAGYYASAASKTVSAGTAGTPTATKGTVSNHSINITPSVTNTTGWITGSTKTGTAVTVNASELVNGSSAISSNGIYDVTNYASAVVSINYVTYYTGRDAPSSALGQDGDIYLQL